MAPIKFEEHIKDSLEQRTIQPSADAWNQLSSKLDTSERKKSNRLFFYIGIAASIVGVLLVSSIMFKTSSEQSISPTVVETNVNTDTIEQSSNTEEIQLSDIVNSDKNDTTINNKDVVVATSSIKNEQHNVVSSNPAAESENESRASLKAIDHINLESPQVHTVASNDQQKDPSDLLKPANALTFEDAKALQVAAEIKKIEVAKGEVTDLEIEHLLKQAEKEILKNRIFNETTRTVDANALLQDVENDLEQSFRTKVFESLKSNYKTVKTAVAERNN